MAELRVNLFGKFSVFWGEQEEKRFHSKKAQELFCYLLIHRDRPISREKVAGLIWGYTSTPRSKKYLRQALWQLQSVLKPRLGGEIKSLLSIDPDWVQLHSGGGFWLDVADFERIFVNTRGVLGSELDSRSFEEVQQAVNLYQGDLLEGWYQDWCLAERERYQNMHLTLLEKLAGYFENHQDCENGLALCRRILWSDMTREKIHRRMMRLYCYLGDRTAALRQYESCAQALMEELGVAPSNRTESLYQEIRSGKFDTRPPSMAQHGPTSAPSRAQIKEVAQRLRKIEMLLKDARRQIIDEINLIDGMSAEDH